MDVPKDLGQRILEATRLAVMLHLEHELRARLTIGTESGSRALLLPGGAGWEIGRAEIPIDGVDCLGGAAMDGGDSTPLPAELSDAGTLAWGGAPAAETEVS